MEILKVQSILIEFKINPTTRGEEFMLLKPEFSFSPSAGLSKSDFYTAIIGMNVISEYKNQQGETCITFTTGTQAIVNIKNGDNENEICRQIAKTAIKDHNVELSIQTNKNNVKMNSSIKPEEKEDERLAAILLEYFKDLF